MSYYNYDTSTRDFYTYPENWGAETCQKWHKHAEGPCAYANGTVKPDAPSFCDDVFCFVDYDECDYQFDKTSFYGFYDDYNNTDNLAVYSLFKSNITCYDNYT